MTDRREDHCGGQSSDAPPSATSAVPGTATKPCKGLTVSEVSRHEEDCPCYPDCSDTTCQGCDCGAAEIATLRESLAAAEATQARIAQESEARLQRIGRLEAQMAAQVEVSARLGAERAQATELAREWREKAERLMEAGLERAQEAIEKMASGDRVALAGFRASATALATVMQEFLPYGVTPEMAAAEAIGYIRHLWDQLQRTPIEPQAHPLCRSTIEVQVPPAPPTGRTFYLIWCPEGSSPPRYRHANEMDARLEAERLAKANSGRAFFVLRTTGMAIHRAVLWLDHEIAEEEISPFEESTTP